MSLDAWLLFCATETALCFSPGPAVLLVIAQSLTAGTKAGLAASLGILATNAMYFALSGTGLGALLTASGRAFNAIAWAGAGYLVWLGARMILGARHSAARARLEVASEVSRHRPFPLAVLTQGANPKAIVFFVAILPQFIDASAPVLPQILILGVSSVVIEFLVLGIYVATCRAARQWVAQPRFAGLLECAGGVFLVGAGIRLAIIGRG